MKPQNIPFSLHIIFIAAAFFFLHASKSHAKGVDFSLDSVTIPKSVNLIYTQVFNEPFMMAPDVITDNRMVSFHITPQLDAKDFYTRYLANMGIGLTRKNGVDYLYVKKEVPVQLPQYTFVYTPKFRSVGYLTSILTSIVQGAFGTTPAASSASAPASGKVTNFALTGDVLVFYGTAADIRRIEQVLPSIDTPTSEVYVGGYVYQVQTSTRNGSGLALAAQLLSQRFSVQIGGTTAPGMDNFIKFSSGDLSALVQLFNTDSRFTVVSSPSLRARSGASASFSVGEDVPVLSNVTYTGQTGAPVQSVEYRSSGVIFNVLPEVRQDSIDLTISQELSNFAKTDTGVNNSPTLIKRNIQTSVSVKSGDIILIGGLADNKDTEANTGLSFMPSWFSTKGNEKTKTDIVIVLQAKKVTR